MVRPSIALFLLVAVTIPCRAEVTLQLQTDHPAVSSGSIFTPDGTLVRTLWSNQKNESGARAETWDGKDNFGAEAPAGEYRLKIATLDDSAYRNVGAIGNSGQKPDPANHTPTTMLGICVDSDGAVYTANGWDEAGADFKKWDSDGKSVYDAQYQMRNGQPNGAPYAITADDEYIYCAMSGWADDTWKEAQQIQRFHRKDGKAEPFTKTGRKDGHIQLYEWPSKLMPAGTPLEDQEIWRAPLRGIAILGNDILVTDAIAEGVRVFDKVTGEERRSPPSPSGSVFPRLKWERPVAIAFGRQHLQWLGYGHHYVGPNESQKQQKTPARTISDVGEVESIAFGPDGLLYVADSAAGQVKIFDVSGPASKLVRTLGKKALPGDRDPSHFFRLRGVAVDRSNNVFTIQTEPTGGARLAKWSPEATLLWEQYGTEFVSLGNYGMSDPDIFWTITMHRHRLVNHDSGKWDYAGNAFYGGTKRFMSDPHGVVRVVHLGDADFVYFPTGDGIQVYRAVGKVLKPAALVGGKSPSPDGERDGKQLGEWSWSDTQGDGEPQSAEINWFKKAGEGSYGCFGMDVDRKGNIIFANTATQSIWEIPMGKSDARGNPTYDWKDARELVKKDTTAFKFEPNMAQRADDGSIYAFGWSSRWPQPKDNPFWMGGLTLVKFDEKGDRLWAAPLPDTCVGFETIPTGGPDENGVMVGSGKNAAVFHYSATGMLVGLMMPGDAMGKQSGWLDNHACVAVSRDPRDHKLDVFVEDDLVLRIGWYRVTPSLESKPAEVVLKKE